MHLFEIDQEVDVRYSITQPWYPAVVTGTTPNSECYTVALDAPLPTRLQWTGISRPLGNDSEVAQTLVFVQLDKLAPGQLMKNREA